jgi:uroporphyrinogen-III synthase
MMESLEAPRVLLTRSAEDCELWVASLTQMGAEPTVLPCIETESIWTRETAQRVIASLAEASWLLLSSRRAVWALAEMLEETTSSLPASLQIAVVGPSTSNECERLLRCPEMLSEGGTVMSLCAQLLPEVESGGRVLSLVSSRSDRRVDAFFEEEGVSYQRFDVYRTSPCPPQVPRTPLSSTASDLVFLASPSAVEGLLNQVDVDVPARFVSIGPTTSAALRAAGLVVFAEAKTRSLSGLLMSCGISSSMKSEIALNSAPISLENQS